MLRVVRSPAARADLIEHYLYLTEEASQAVAERFLIFYLPRPGDILVVRVLHSSRDWWHLLSLAG